MNEYLSDTGNRFLNEISSDAAKIADWAAKNDAMQYINIIAGLQEGRLDEIKDGAVPTAPELLAFCDAVRYLSVQPGNEGFAEAAQAAGSLRLRWMEERFCKVKNAGNIVDALVEASDMEDEAAFLRSYHFFLDASSLCCKWMPVFLNKLLPAMCHYGSRFHITVPQAVVNCLEELAKDPGQAELSRANEGLAQLKEIQDAGLMSIRGDEGDSTLLSTFLSAFSRYKPEYRMALITQDETLANAVHLLNASGVEGDDILIASLQEDGVPQMWFRQDGSAGRVSKESKKSGDAFFQDFVSESTGFSSGSGDEEDDGFDDGIDEAEDSLSEEELEKILSINALLPSEDDSMSQDGSSHSLEENMDDLESLEEEPAVSTSQMEPGFDEEDEEEYVGKSSPFLDDAGEEMEHIQQNSSWSTLE